MEPVICQFTPEQLSEMGYTAYHQVGDALLGILLMTYGKGRLVADINFFGYEDFWCYESEIAAALAMFRWDPRVSPEPTGWMRHPRSGRRRPNGDATQEYIAM